jgi:EmrB/QacA subfamily drug resistance transporter
VVARAPEAGAAPADAARTPWLSLGVLCLGSFAILLDTTVVNTAIPTLLTDLHASFELAVWVINAYLLVFAALLIVGGRLGDMYGPRRMFIVGLAVFGLSSALCGAAQTPGQLVAARAIQGVGAAVLSPQGLVLIRATFPPDRMGAAFGLFSSTIGLAAVCGPTLGGLLITSLGWRWIFYINPPIALVGIIGAVLVIPEVRTVRRHRLDPFGVLLASLGLTALIYGLIEGQEYDWGRITTGITIPEVLAAGAVLLLGFVLWERRHPEPLMPLGLFRIRTFAIMAGLTLATQFALQSQFLVNAVTMQTVLGMSPVRYGLTSLPLTVALVLLAPFAGRLTDGAGGRYTLLAGLAVFAIGVLWVAAATVAHATSLSFAPPLLVEGVGLAAVFSPLNTMAMRSVSRASAGSASGVVTTSRQLGAALGSSVTGAMLANRLGVALHGQAVTAAGTLPAAVRPAFVAGFSQSATSDLQIGRGETGVSMPSGVPAALADRVRTLIDEVFANAYFSAVRPTMYVTAAVLLAGAAACLLLPRRPAAPQDVSGTPDAGPADEAERAGRLDVADAKDG